MGKYYDEFSRLTLDKMVQKMEEMTYAYDHTQVPKKHYKELLQKEMIELMTQDNVIQSMLLGVIIQQLQNVKKESYELFFKALICLDNGIKPDQLNQSILDKLTHTWETHQKDKLLLSKEIHRTYKKGE